MKLFAALILALFVFSERVYAESISETITVLIRVEPPLALLINKEETASDLKSATDSKGKNYTRQAKNNTVLYTVTE